MALQRATLATPLWPEPTQVDGVVAGIYDLNPVGNNGSWNAAMTGASGATAGTTVFQIVPNGTGFSAVSGAAIAAGNSKGWMIPPTSAMGSTASVQRVINAGSVLSQTGYFFGATSTLGATVTFTGVWYLRATNGALTKIAQANANVAIPAAASNTTLGDFTVSGTVAVDCVFAPGETLYQELYVTVPGALTANSISLNINSAATQSFAVTPNGISFRTITALSASSVHTAALQKAAAVRRSASITATAALQQVIKPIYTATSTHTAALVRNFPRAFTASTAHTASLALQVSQAILNRLAGGATTVIRRIFQMTDD